ncbi:Cytochrome bd ubiquinol oxidase subunit 1 [compost metagenome]
MLSGWVVTEVGRQPFTVYGLLRTTDSVSPVATSTVLAATVAILAFYVITFGIGLWLLLHVLRRAPALDEAGPEPRIGKQP